MIMQTLWLLATNPDAQAALRQELLSKLTPDARPDYRTLTKDLPYLDAVVYVYIQLVYFCANTLQH